MKYELVKPDYFCLNEHSVISVIFSKKLTSGFYFLGSFLKLAVGLQYIISLYTILVCKGKQKMNLKLFHFLDRHPMAVSRFHPRRLFDFREAICLVFRDAISLLN